MSMSPDEQKDFLVHSRCIARISSFNKDGSIHAVPVWYMFDDKNIVVTSDASSRHVKNIKRRKDLTILIDTVQFPTKGVKVRGSATIEEGEEQVHNYELKITRRYISEKLKAEEYVKKRETSAKRVAIIISPEKVSNWDFSKDEKEKEFFKDKPVYSLNDY